ncbi:MAG: response regulator transcription factor [Spirochaetota bacterium]
MDVVRLALTESQELVRTMLTSVFAQRIDIHVVETFSCGNRLLEHCYRDADFCDVVLISSEIKDVQVPRLVETVKKQTSSSVVCLDFDRGVSFAEQVVVAGTDAIVKSYDSLEQVAATILMHGSSLRAGSFSSHSADRACKDGVELSGREKVIVKMMMDGYTANDISLALNISPTTVETYRRRLRDKTKTSNAAALVYFVLQNNLLEA